MENRREKKVLSTLAWKRSCPKTCTMEDVILILLTILATQSTSSTMPGIFTLKMTEHCTVQMFSISVTGTADPHSASYQ